MFSFSSCSSQFLKYCSHFLLLFFVLVSFGSRFFILVGFCMTTQPSKFLKICLKLVNSLRNLSAKIQRIKEKKRKNSCSDFSKMVKLLLSLSFLFCFSSSIINFVVFLFFFPKIICSSTFLVLGSRFFIFLPRDRRMSKFWFTLFFEVFEILFSFFVLVLYLVLFGSLFLFLLDSGSALQLNHQNFGKFD